MAYYHYQCQYCLCTTYLYDDEKDDGIEETGAFDDCGCMDGIEDQDDDFDEDDD